MTIHLTIWWLWWTLIGLYALGAVVGLLATMIADDLEWWQRPAIAIWPLILAALVLWHGALFLIGKE
jgi:hypothetical protein